MIDYEDAEKLALGALGFGGGLLAYLGRNKKKEKEGEDEEEANLSFIQDQLIKLEGERDAANKAREEVSIRSLVNIADLVDIVRRLCYMLASSECPRAEKDKHEIIAIIKYRKFDMKESLLPELLELFGLQEHEVKLLIPAAVPESKTP